MEWIEATDEGLLYLSVLTLGKIRKGLAGLGKRKRRTQLETWLEVELQARFSVRIPAIDPSVADRWGLLATQAKGRGVPLAIIDGLLAATALHYKVTVISRNPSDFTNAQVQALNPWEA